jgi:hypothetical protein
MRFQLRESRLMRGGWTGLSAAAMALGLLLASAGLLLTLSRRGHVELQRGARDG